MTEDMENIEVCKDSPDASDSANIKLPESTSMEEAAMDEDVIVNNEGEQETMDEKVEERGQLEVNEGVNEDNAEVRGSEEETKDDKEEGVKEKVDDGETGEQASIGPLKDISNDDISVNREEKGSKEGKKDGNVKEKVDGEEASVASLKHMSSDDISVYGEEKGSKEEKTDDKVDGGQTGEEASGSPLKDVSNGDFPVNREGNTAMALNPNDGDSHIDAPVPDPSLGNGLEVDEQVALKAEGGLEEEVSTEHQAVFLNGQEHVDNSSVSYTTDGTVALPSGPSAPTSCLVKEEVKHMENTEELSLSMNNTEEIEASYFDSDSPEGGESGTEEEQSSFVKELERVYKELHLEFRPPKFYGEPLNLLKLWRAVIKLDGYDKVTACKLWRQVGESFRPPKTCTTVSWTFRQFYEKALLEYERHKVRSGTLNICAPVPMSIHDSQAGSNHTPGSGSGRSRRDAAARAMQGWQSQRLLKNGEVGDPIIKDKSAIALKNREKHLKTIGLPKRKRPLGEETPPKVGRPKVFKIQSENTRIIDVGPPADWVKVNVKITKDCYEVYALVPGLLREEVRVQTDPAGRLVISGEPQNADNPWGVIPFKKIVTLPSRIDPHQTSAVVTLHGQLFVRVPFEQSD